MRLHTALAKGLAELGTDCLFGVTGNANLHLVDAWVRDQGLRYVAATHEAAAVTMADGYARVSRRLGIATVTHGPGLTNAVTSLIEARKGRTPMLVFCGDTAASAEDEVQDVDQPAIVRATGAGLEQVRAPGRALAHLERAARRAWAERRPIVLNVPIDLQDAEVDDQYPPLSIPAGTLTPDPDAIDRALGLIATAQRPLVLAGRGAGSQAGGQAVGRFADRIGAPVATTLLASGSFPEDPSSIGVFGTFSTPAAIDVISSSDCIIAFGASLNRWTTADGSLLHGKRVVQVDADVESFGSSAAVDVGVVGDANVVAQAFLDLLEDDTVDRSAFRDRASSRATTRGGPPAAAQRSGPPVTIDVPQLVARLDEALPPARTLVTDVGRFMGEVWRGIHVNDADAFVHTANFGSVGLGMAAAVGACFGAPHRTTVLAIGDGGFMMGGLHELATARRHDLDLVVVVFNDGAYGAEHRQLRDRGLPVDLVQFDWPDLATIAGSFGLPTCSVSSMDEVGTALSAIDGGLRPLVIDLCLDPEMVPGVHGEEPSGRIQEREGRTGEA